MQQPSVKVREYYRYNYRYSPSTTNSTFYGQCLFPLRNLKVEYSEGLLYNIGAECVISCFRREVDDNCAPLGYYAASSGNFLPTFRDNQSIPSSKVKT